MAKPTPEQVFEMKSRKLVKEIWEAHFNRSKDEFTSISLRANVIEIKIENRGVTIHRGE
jgi:hypothetical protein